MNNIKLHASTIINLKEKQYWMKKINCEDVYNTIPCNINKPLKNLMA